MVLDGLALHQEDDVLPDVGGQVGHPLEIPAHQEELHARPDHVGVFHHVGEEDAEHRAVQRVHLVVPETDLAAGRRVPPNESLEGVGKHVPGEPGHLDDLGLRRDRPALREPLRALGDVDRVVADPLEIVGDLERGGEHPEVPRHRLLQGEEVDALLLDLDLHAVDHPVAHDDPVGLVGIPLEQRLHREAEGGLRLARHGEQPDLHVAQLVVKVAVNVEAHPNLPVM